MVGGGLLDITKGEGLPILFEGMKTKREELPEFRKPEKRKPILAGGSGEGESAGRGVYGEKTDLSLLKRKSKFKKRLPSLQGKASSHTWTILFYSEKKEETPLPY